MKINHKTFRNLVKDIISELDLNESDIITKNKNEWNDTKNDFKNTIKELVKNIDDDKYEDVQGDIDKSIRILKSWKKRIEKNLSDSSGM